MKTLTDSQVRILLHAASKTNLEALFWLAVTTGLRQSEMLGLKWDDLDWSTRRLSIQRQLQRVTRQGLIFTEPKTAASKRSVVIGGSVMTKLRAHRVVQSYERLFCGDRWHESGLIFLTPMGTPLDHRNLFKHFKAILKESHLPNIRFHDLRHTAATLMLQQNVNPKVVQERLGHSDISLTLNTYSHVLPAMQEQAAQTLDALLSDPPPPRT